MNDKASRARRQQRVALIAAEKKLTEFPNQQSAAPEEPAWKLRLAAFPDPWLFDSEKLIRELDRCRELFLAVPSNGDQHAVHMAVNIAIDSLWNLRQTLRHLLHVHREGQREFAKKVPGSGSSAPPAPKTKKQAATA